MKVLATKGDLHLGGKDLDKNLLDFVVQKFTMTYPDTKIDENMIIRFSMNIEKLKFMLSSTHEVAQMMFFHSESN